MLDLETFPSFLKSDTKTRICLDKDKKMFILLRQELKLYSLNYKNKNLNWLFNLTNTNLTNRLIYFFLHL